MRSASVIAPWLIKSSSCSRILIRSLISCGTIKNGINTFLIMSSGRSMNSSSTRTLARKPRIFSPLRGIAFIEPSLIDQSYSSLRFDFAPNACIKRSAPLDSVIFSIELKMLLAVLNVGPAIKILLLGSNMHCKKQNTAAEKDLEAPRPHTLRQKFRFNMALITTS